MQQNLFPDEPDKRDDLYGVNRMNKKDETPPLEVGDMVPVVEHEDGNLSFFVMAVYWNSSQEQPSYYPIKPSGPYTFIGIAPWNEKRIPVETEIIKQKSHPQRDGFSCAAPH